jgi:hypothetical protein
VRKSSLLYFMLLHEIVLTFLERVKQNGTLCFFVVVFLVAVYRISFRMIIIL